MTTAPAHIPTPAVLPFASHERVAGAWGWFVRVAPHLTDDEASVYLLALGTAHTRWERGDLDGMGTRLDELKAFALAITERLGLVDPASLDAHGRTAYDRKRRPLDATEAFGVPMRPALPSEPAGPALSPALR